MYFESCSKSWELKVYFKLRIFFFATNFKTFSHPARCFLSVFIETEKGYYFYDVNIFPTRRSHDTILPVFFSDKFEKNNIRNNKDPKSIFTFFFTKGDLQFSQLKASFILEMYSASSQ